MKTLEEIANKIIDNLTNRSGFNDLWYNLDEDIQDEIKDEIVNILPIHLVSNSDTLLVAEKLLKYDYNPLIGGKWALCEKGSNMTIITKDTKEELFDYVTAHCC